MLENLDNIIWNLEIKQRDALLQPTRAYRNELKDIYTTWLEEFFDELEDTPEEDRREYILAALLLLSRRLKEIQRIRLLSAFELGLAGDPASPEALEELAKHIREQENYIDESLIPHLEAHFLDKLDELPEIGQDAFEESLLKRAYRVGLYAGAFWAAIQLAKVMISQPDRRFEWIARDDEGTCSECAEYSGKVYTKQTLPTLPGVNIECDGNCRCWLMDLDPLEIWS